MTQVSEMWEAIKIKKETKNKIMIDCVEEFRKHHPELDEVPITQNKMFFELARFYLGED